MKTFLFAGKVSGGSAARAVAATMVRGRVTSLQHHTDETPASLNYKRALVSLLTPAQHSLRLAYHAQVSTTLRTYIEYMVVSERKHHVSFMQNLSNFKINKGETLIIDT